MDSKILFLIQVHGSVDVEKMMDLLLKINITPRRNGKWLYDTILTNQQLILNYLNGDIKLDDEIIKHEIVQEVTVKNDLQDFYDFMNDGELEESKEIEEIEERLPDDVCANTIEVEALEILRRIALVNFSGDNGLICLENDLLLYDGSDEWILNMKKEWEFRLHSQWVDTFMNALELWIVSKI